MLKPLTRYLPLLVLLLGLAGCAVSPPETGKAEQKGKATAGKLSPQAAAAFDRAIWSVKAGRDEEALQLFRQMTSQYPDVAIGFINRGLLELKFRKYPEAEQSFRQAVALKPANAVAYTHLGIAYRNQGKFEAALAAYQQAIKADPDYELAWLNMGILYDIYLQDLPQALASYQRYKTLHKADDKTVDKWIVDLTRRVKTMKKKSGQTS